MGLGVAFTPFETRTDVIARVATRAENAGLDHVGVAEGWTHDSLILLAELAMRTSRIGLGTAIISAWGRTPATIALAATGLQRCSAGRFTLGIGASSPPLTEGLHGIRWDRPLARLRETLTAVRALLAGARLPSPAPGARALRLGAIPDAPVPIHLAALSPGAVRLAESSPTGGRRSSGRERACTMGARCFTRASCARMLPPRLGSRSACRSRSVPTNRAHGSSRPGGCRPT